MILDPIEVTSLKAACTQKLKQAILAGDYKVNERLPSERDLAKMLGVSRPVVHQAILELEQIGLIRIEPRSGTYVNDYRRDGSIALLTTLLEYSEGILNPNLLRSLIETRMLIEQETARLAAEQRTTQQLVNLKALLNTWDQARGDSIQAMVEYDFNFHLEIALASGNEMYPLLINSLKSVHQNLAGKFYTSIINTSILEEVLGFHKNLISAIEDNDPDRASQTMAEMLKHGEKHLNKLVQEED